jgi:hypothetical protein
MVRLKLSAKRLLTEAGQDARGAAFMPLHASTTVLRPDSRDHFGFPSRSGMNAALLADTFDRTRWVSPTLRRIGNALPDFHFLLRFLEASGDSALAEFFSDGSG